MTASPSTPSAAHGIAVIGMACHLPGAVDPEAFWKRICEGFEAVVDFSRDELIERGVPQSLIDHPDYVPSGIVVEGTAEFDPGFFGLSPREAAVMDPQHRKFFETGWAALENAGHRPTDVDSAIGVFAGAGMDWYLIRNVLTHSDILEDMGEFLIRHTANDKDFLATRLSYLMNLQGPSINVQTACSTSLVAIHTAFQSLMAHECDMAIAGGSSFDVPQGVGYVYKEEEVRSRDGRCRAFDADSTGTAFGSGCAAVVLRRLEDAIEDGDTIYAVVRGTAINNDGSRKVGYMAPSVDGHADVIAEALAVADFDPSSIGYVETHGTGTRLGDPIEIAAFQQAFGETAENQFCAVGSVKTNIGHLDTAAGAASFIKAVQAVRHQKIPPSLHYQRPNPEIDFENSPFYVANELSDWLSPNRPRRAGVSSLGVGGTNAHVVVEEAPQPVEGADRTRPYELLVVSAKTREAAENAVQRLSAHFTETDRCNFADAAYTLQVGRVPMKYRAAFVCRDQEHAKELLSNSAPKLVASPESEPRVAFMFSGQGSQYVGMAKGLYDSEPVFRDAVDRCLDALQRDPGLDLRPILFPDEANSADAEAKLNDTRFTQPALFVVEYAMAQLWMSWGIEPVALAGHSLGEYVAAVLAGVFDVEDGVRLVAERGRLIGSLPRGKMVAVSLDAEEAHRYETDGVCLAAVNAPQLCVLSGPSDSIDKLTERLQSDGANPRVLRTSHAFHSSMMDPVLDVFRQRVAAVSMRAPKLAFVSNVTGTWITASEAVDPDYWARHIRSAVRFAENVQCIAADGRTAFLEVGPSNTLANLAQLTLADEAGHVAISSLPHSKDKTPDAAAVLEALGQLWSNGCEPDWQAFHGDARRRRIALPTYSFAKTRCWLEPAASTKRNDRGLERCPMDDWFYVPNWRQVMPSAGPAPGSGSHVLLFASQHPLCEELARRLRAGGARLSVVRPAQNFELIGPGSYALRPGERDDYEKLRDALKENSPTHVVHAWGIGAGLQPGLDVDDALKLGFFSLLSFAQAWADQALDDSTRLVVVSDGVFSVRGDEVLNPTQAAMLGPVRVIPEEFTGLSTRLVDLDLSASRGDWVAEAQCILSELGSEEQEAVAAIRGRRRYLQRFDRLEVPQREPSRPALQKNAHYLITGASGGLGRVVCEHLAKEYQASLSLVVRGAWTQDPSDPKQIEWQQFVDRLEKHGAHVKTIVADITNQTELEAGIDASCSELGPMHGAFHMAGWLDDGLISLKTSQSAMDVFAPKIHGTIVLERALRKHEPAFVVLYSSLSSIAGLSGQVDYTAANAYLDTFAHAASSHGPTRYLAVDWSVWRDTGMAARLSTEIRLPTAAGKGLQSLNHTVFSHVRSDEAEADFFGELTPDRQWYVNEHRLRTGEPILPGTAYIELINTAFGLWRGQAPSEIKNLTFAVPLQIAKGATSIIHCRFESKGDGWFEVDFMSRQGKDAEPVEHAHGLIRSAPDLDDEFVPNEAVAGERESVAQAEHKLLQFGPRWACLAGRRIESDRALLDLNLDDAYADDFAQTPVHPAMLDIATGGVSEFLDGNNGEQAYVPFMYRSVRICNAMEPILTSIVTKRAEEDAEQVALDVRVVSPTGKVLIDIDGFVMRRIPENAAASRSSGVSQPSSFGTVNKILDIGLKSGITPAEGMQVLERLLAAETPEQIIVCTQELDQLLDESRRQSQIEDEDVPLSETADNMLDRPELSVPFVAPETDKQKSIAVHWQNALGTKGLGLDDDFFELGGHSLLLTQIVSRIRRDQGWSLPLDKVFESPSIRDWANLIDDAQPAAEAEPQITRIDRNRYREGTSLLEELR